ncbi:histidine phosphatase family protein [Actibacterium pelagium]|uniref:histidine phosphatase family protein n=1 Tax=Actibacterium pelagium TaxID=2029103 RepID=UPI000BAA9B6B|nr:histidine phosphatase family protein [Actibacterium pelagium]
MPPPKVTRLSLIRHAPAQDGGCLAGRRDVPAHPGDAAQIEALQALLGQPDVLISSPAQRCLQTTNMLWPDLKPTEVPSLWEQDFGDWEGTPYGELPDIGLLATSELAAHRPPNGESFNDLRHRISEGLKNHIGKDATIICHAGVIRAALSWALDLGPSALSFAIEPLSLTQIELTSAGNRATRVNWTVS